MGELLAAIRRFLAELRRRNVYRVATTYVVVAFVGLQTARMAVPLTTLPSWADELMLALAIAGFPITLVVAWAFEVTPEGVRPTPEAGDAGGADSRPEAGEARDRGAEESRAAGGRQGVALAVLALLLAGGAAWWAFGSFGPSPAEARETRSVAVLPFRDLSATESRGDIGLGLTDAVISELSVVGDLTPVARTAVARFRGSQLPVTDIADSLNVEFLVEGSVQRSADSLRVDARLLRADTGRPIWTRTFGGDFSRVFEVQSDVALAVVDAVEARATEGERRRIRERSTESPAAYSLYLRARELVGEGPENEAAIELLRQAVRLDSTFALGYANLANAYEEQVDRGVASVGLDSALSLARRGVELDPGAADAHYQLGHILRNLGRLEEAEGAYRRALALQPGHAWAAYDMGYLAQVQQGRWAEGLRWLWRTLTSLPGHPYPRSAIGIILYHMGEDEAARAWRERMMELGYPRGHRWLIQGALGRGELEPARRHLQGLREWDPDHSLTLGWSGVLAQMSGDTTAALEDYRRALRQPASQQVMGIPTGARLAQLLRASGSGRRADSLSQEVIRERRRVVEEVGRFPLPLYSLAAALKASGDTARARLVLDSAYTAGARWHRAQRRDPIWHGFPYAREYFDRIEQDLLAQKAAARRWAREEGLEWPLMPPDREVLEDAAADSAMAAAAEVPAIAASASGSTTRLGTGDVRRVMAASGFGNVAMPPVSSSTRETIRERRP